MNVELIRPSAVIALLDGTPTGPAPTAGRPTRAWRRLAARLAEQRRYLAALRELSRLDDRDLADIGIGRDDLPSLARSHARGGLLPA
jgi:uncharacterized protein YjiS (DUF1127 family)